MDMITGSVNYFKRNLQSFSNIRYYSVVLTTTTFVCLMYSIKILCDDKAYWLCSIQYVVIFCTLKSARYDVYNLLSDINATELIAD